MKEYTNVKRVRREVPNTSPVRQLTQKDPRRMLRLKGPVCSSYSGLDGTTLPQHRVAGSEEREEDKDKEEDEERKESEHKSQGVKSQSALTKP